MNGDFTNAFAESIGTMWDSEEPIYSDEIDMRAVMYFQHQIMVQPMPEERPEMYDNGGEF
jgi:hypothetical protein